MLMVNSSQPDPGFKLLDDVQINKKLKLCDVICDFCLGNPPVTKKAIDLSNKRFLT